MLVFVVAALTCWLCALLARPAAIDADAAVLREELVGTGSVLLPDTRDTRGCFVSWFVAPVCWRAQPDGAWLVEGQLDDGTWVKGTPREDGTWSLVGLVVMPGEYPSAREWDGGGRQAMAGALLSIGGSTACTCWLCALLTWPRRPRPSDELD